MKSTTVLHIFPDDKFLDDIFDLMDEIPFLQNIYLFWAPSSYSFKYIRNKERIIVVDNINVVYDWFRDDRVDVVLFHTLPPFAYPLVLKIPPSKKVVWSSWGFDIYKGQEPLFSALLPIPLYMPLTRTVLSTKRYFTFKDFVKLNVDRLTGYYSRLRKQALERIDYISTVLPNEYDLLLQHHPQLKARQFLLNYPFPKNFGITEHSNEGKYILIGNSATPENNHLDILNQIEAYDFCGKRLLLPLNYGDKNYAHTVQQRYSWMEQKGHLFLTDLMPFESYRSLIGNVSVAIFGHKRQQALGNIFLALSSGAKVFLYKESVAYPFLLEKGFKLFSIEEDLCEDALKEPLAPYDVQLNKELFLEFFSWDSIKKRIEISFKEITDL